MLNRRNGLIAVLAVLAILIGYGLLARSQTILVEVESVVSRTFTAYVEEDGRTRVRDRFIVSAPLSGRMPRSELSTGQQVRVGTLLATIAPNFAPLLDPRIREELDEKVGAAEAGLEEAKAIMERGEIAVSQARTDLQRTRQLEQKGVVSPAQLDRDTFSLQSAERQLIAFARRLHAAEHTLAQARAALQRSKEPTDDQIFSVTSPVDGRVLKIIQESEAVVSIGAPLVELGDTGDLEVVVDVLTSDAARIRPGAAVSLERWGGPTAIEGRVRRIDPSGFTKISALGVEEQRVWVVIDITSPREQWTALADGYRVDARITTDVLDNATVIPVGALFRRGPGWFVFVIENDTARLRQVEISLRSGRHAVVSNGLKADEIVIVYPPGSLEDGSRVRIAVTPS